MTAPPHAGLPVQLCGCASPPRRVCDVCPLAPFLACSAACLRRHQSAAHGGSHDAPIRALDYQVGLNRNFETGPQRYASHRDRLMRLVAAAGPGRDICILGAGNGADLDPEQLARDFSKIHLVDIDSEALERARESFPAPARDRVVLHEGVDLSGFMGRLDDWGDNFPDDRALAQAALAVIHALIEQLGGPFDVVLSTCVLSQLPLPFRRTWITSRTNWDRLTASLTAVHLATLAGSVQRGGHGIIAFDLFGARAAPGLEAVDGNDSAALQSFVDQQVSGGIVRLDWDPAGILERLKSPAMSAIVHAPRLVGPWLWDTGNVLVVYGLVFDRPQ